MAAVRVIFKGDQVARRVVNDSLVIGRGDECGLRVTDGGVSRAHCRIERTATGYFVVDLGSRNGTVVDGTRVTRRALRDGDVLRVGNYTLQFESGIPAARTLDDEVLEMLNDVAPSPPEELEAVGAAIRGPEADVEDAHGALAAVAVQSSPDAHGPVPVASSRPDLWGAAIATPAVQPARPAKTDRRTRSGAWPWIGRLRSAGARASEVQHVPWVQRRIPVPAAVAAAVVAIVIVYLLTWGFPDSGPRVDSSKPMHHARHARSAD